MSVENYKLEFHKKCSHATNVFYVITTFATQRRPVAGGPIILLGLQLLLFCGERRD